MQLIWICNWVLIHLFMLYRETTIKNLKMLFTFQSSTLKNLDDAHQIDDYSYMKGNFYISDFIE